jgi:hypothetical protein
MNNFKHLPSIIAITGYKGSGKDTIANYYCKKYGYENIKFADKLKDIVCILLDITREELELNKDKPGLLIDFLTDFMVITTPEHTINIYDMTYRDFLIFIGTDLFQHKIKDMHPMLFQDKSFWARSLFTNKLSNNIKNGKKYIISDLRFIHEYKIINMFCNNNNFLYKIINVNNNRINKIETHSSETEFINIPYNIRVENNSSINDLHLKLDLIL